MEIRKAQIMLDTVFISFDEGIKIKRMLDTVVPLDMDFDLKGGEG